MPPGPSLAFAVNRRVALTLVFAREFEEREELLSSRRPSFSLPSVNTNIFDNSDPFLPNYLSTSHDPFPPQSINMTSQVTPSKTVRFQLPPRLPTFASSKIPPANTTQAASAIEGLKMGDSPAKKLNFDAVGKENVPFNADAPVVDDIEIKKSIVEEVKTEKAVVAVAPTIKPEEADEPLLQENPQRFVLFPIKYHEVSRVDALTRKVVEQCLTFLHYRFGRCTRRPRHLSGPPKRLICQKIFTTGTTGSTMMSDTSFPTSLHSSQHQTELSTRTWWSASAERSRYQRLDASTDFKS